MIPAFHILHVFSVLMLTGLTFYAFAGAPETRKRTLALAGVASLLTLIAGFGLQGTLKLGFPGWLIVKVVCWFGLSGLAGMGYRRRQSVGVLGVVAAVLVIVALAMVYLRPF